MRECSPRLATHIVLLVCTGLRSGELQGLRKQDVDLKAGFLHVRQQLDGPTKTRMQRSIPIHPRMRPILKKLIALDEHELLLTALPSQRYPAGGRPISTGRLVDQFKAAASRAGISGFTVHALRRAFNTIALNVGVPETVAKLWMGHAIGGMTDRYFCLDAKTSLEFMVKVPFDAVTTEHRANRKEIP